MVDDDEQGSNKFLFNKNVEKEQERRKTFKDNYF